MEHQASERCVGCGAVVPRVAGPVHRYMTSAPGCWALWGTLNARLMSEPSHGPYRQLIVDTYAVQHPGTPGPQAIQSVGAHLVSTVRPIGARFPVQQDASGHRVLDSGQGHLPLAHATVVRWCLDGGRHRRLRGKPQGPWARLGDKRVAGVGAAPCAGEGVVRLGHRRVDQIGTTATWRMIRTATRCILGRHDDPEAEETLGAVVWEQYVYLDGWRLAPGRILESVNQPADHVRRTACR